MTKRKLLFVDDEPDFTLLVKQELEDKIGEHDVAFIFAYNGLEALKKLEEHQDIELVLIDMNMPVMDGLEFVIRAKQLDRLLKIIMVSAYSDMTNLRKAMNLGAYDFITKPINFYDLSETIKKTLNYIDQVRVEETELKRLQEIEKEMEIAKKILSSLLPTPTLPPSYFQNMNFEVFGTLGAAPMMCGCFYDFFPADSTKLAIVVGEIEAKGIAAAIYVSSAREAIRKFINQKPDLIRCSKQINNYLFYQKMEEIPSFPLFLGLFNTLTGKLEYVSTGLPPVIFVSSEGSITEQTIENPLLGSSLNTDLNIKKIMLHKNESLVVYSKGIKKIKNKNNDTYPSARFKELISAHHAKPLTSLIDHIAFDIRNFIDPVPLSHDYIVLSLKFKGLK